MKKKISLPVMAVSAILLLGGCGTQMYDLSEDEENLVVQYSAHILAKYNIEQKDGMTAASSEETQETQKQDSQMPESQNTQRQIEMVYLHIIPCRSHAVCIQIRSHDFSCAEF